MLTTKEILIGKEELNESMNKQRKLSILIILQHEGQLKISLENLLLFFRTIFLANVMERV